MDFNYDFQKMRRFIEDVSFILQTGGAANAVAAAGGQKSDVSKKILNGIKLFFVTLAILVLLYILIKILFGGYPRLVYNILTMSFYHKVNIENLLRENDILYGNFDVLADYVDKFSCNGPYDIMEYIYRVPSKNTIGTAAKLGRDLIEKYYSGLTYGKYNITYRYREKYQNAFREYFLFYKTLASTEEDKKTYYFSPKNDDNFVKVVMDNNTFYVVLLTYFIKVGAINPKNPKKGGEISQNELIYDMNMNEKILTKSGKPTLLRQRKEMFEVIKNIAQNLVVLVRKIKESPYHHYFLLPNSETNEKAVTKDFAIVEKQIIDWSIYQKRRSTDLNEYTWYIIEVFYFVHNIKSRTSAWRAAVRNLGSSSGYKRNLVITYLNLPQERKPRAVTRLFSSSDKPFLDMLNKFPLAAKIYYSDIPNSKKEDMYLGVMKLYLKMMSPSCDQVAFEPKNVERLIKNVSYYSKPYKQLINSVLLVDLYLNSYRDQLTKMLSTRYLNVENFYKELWTPHFDDFFNNRIKSYWKRIANMKYFKGEVFLRFKTVWKMIDKKLMEMNKNVWKAFKQEDTTKQPAPPPEEPDYDKSSYDKDANESQNAAAASGGTAAQQDIQNELSASNTAQEANKEEQQRDAAKAAAAQAENDKVQQEQAAEQEKKKQREAAINKAEEDNKS